MGFYVALDTLTDTGSVSRVALHSQAASSGCLRAVYCLSSIAGCTQLHNRGFESLTKILAIVFQVARNTFASKVYYLYF